jgi:manganese transport protein
MEGYLQLRINPWLRRLLTRLIAIAPAVFVILMYGEEKVDDLLVFSQVVLSIQLGFAVIPLIHFVSDKKSMGEFVISRPVKIFSWLVAAILVILNVNLVYNEAVSLLFSDISIPAKMGILLAIGAFIWLFLAMTFYPIIQKRKTERAALMHGATVQLDNLKVKPVSSIAIALDFSPADEKLIAHALAQGNSGVSFTLLHIVESVSARYLAASSDDAETRLDKERLASYVAQLQQMGYKAEGVLGYHNRVNEIVRIVENAGADMLIMGAHGHSGLKDYIFGETIEDVRHRLAIPVLIVNV